MCLRCVRQTKEKTSILQVIRLTSIGIKRHIKIKADANPYAPEFGSYFWRRRNKKDSKLFSALNARESAAH